MRIISGKMKYVLPLFVAGFLVAGPAVADKPGDKGDKGGKHERVERSDHGSRDRDGKDKHTGHGNDHGGSAGKHSRFEDRQQSIVRSYYGEEFRGGRCPPGLAKKNNGCMPPGQAKKWQMGRPLARDVVFYEVPRALVLKIGAPPSGHRYVRVAGDLLMIAIGTGMVVDAIQDLGRI
jgi:Ni/Co efflux regulator RcnB